ncbi:hypothetical protein BC941DRAFT_425623 [Chlamydoabsidia padenii]|nr:hypothetical protein BC941DRAFT_425623 [Chlamydoabsidia padenii]
MAQQERRWQLVIEKLWSTQLKDPVNCITVGKPFLEDLSEENDLMVGTTAGRVLTLNQTKPVVDLLETKGGAVQTLNLQYLTGHGVKDLVVGDADGVVTLFSKQQILTKRPVGAPISIIEIHENLVGGYEIIVGDTSGMISSFRQHDTLWKFNLDQWSRKMAAEDTWGRQSATITCIHSVRLTDPFGLQVSCLLVANGWPMLYSMHQGQCIQTFRTPSPIQSMCSGYFITTQMKNKILNTTAFKSRRKMDTKLDTPQVLLAGQDGNVYIMIDFEIYPWIKIGFHITQISCFRPSGLYDHEPDMVICMGHSNLVKICHHGQVISEIKTKDWPHTMTMGDVNTDGKDELVIGLLDQSIEVYKYSLDLQ